MVRDEAQPVLLERQGAVGVEQVRLILVDQVLDAHEPVALPRLRDAVSSQSQLALGQIARSRHRDRGRRSAGSAPS